MKIKLIHSLFIIFFTFLFLDGCVPTKQISEVPVYSVDRLVKRLEANRRKIKEFVATGGLSIESAEINARSSFEVVIKRPDSLKISFYGPFGIDLAHALITSKDFLFYDVINNIAYRGIMRPGVIKRILKVDMSLSDIIDAMTGSVNLTDKLREEPDNFQTDGGIYKLTYYDESKSIETNYFVKHENLSVTENVVKQTNGTILLYGKYSKHELFDDISIPNEINIDDKINKQKIKIEYKKISLNSNSVNMKIDIPTDVQISEW